MTTPTRQDVIALDEERKSRRARLAGTFDSAKQKLAPSAIAARVSEDKKQRVADAGRRVGTFGKDHKYSIAGTVAAVTAGIAGYVFYNRKKRSDLQDAPNIVVADEPTGSSDDLDKALAQAEPIETQPEAAAAGASV